MKFTILNDDGAVINTIIADLDFMEANHAGRYAEVIEAAIPVLRAPLSKIDFMSLFTAAELAGIYSAAKTIVQIEIWLDKFKLADNIDLHDARTVAGIKALTTAGLLDKGRAAEILA